MRKPLVLRLLGTQLHELSLHQVRHHLQQIIRRSLRAHYDRQRPRCISVDPAAQRWHLHEDRTLQRVLSISQSLYDRTLQRVLSISQSLYDRILQRVLSISQSLYDRTLQRVLSISQSLYDRTLQRVLSITLGRGKTRYLLIISANKRSVSLKTSSGSSNLFVSAISSSTDHVTMLVYWITWNFIRHVSGGATWKCPFLWRSIMRCNPTFPFRTLSALVCRLRTSEILLWFVLVLSPSARSATAAYATCTDVCTLMGKSFTWMLVTLILLLIGWGPRWHSG